MNNLSWFIYFAEVGGNIQGFSIAMAIIIGILTFLWYVLYGLFYQEGMFIVRPYTKSLIFAFLIFCSMAIVIPSRQTLILIGASEFGEKMVTSKPIQELADPSYQLLKQWIERELEKVKDKK